MSRVEPLQLQAVPTVKDKNANLGCRQAALEALESVFGFKEFRGKQEEAVLGILSGRDVFVLMPTGGGKSLCYGLPPLVKPGVAVVVSPLIALMQDQVQSFHSKGIRAEHLSSAQATAERSTILEDLRSGRPSTQLLFVTPELLATEAFMGTLQWVYSAGNLLMVAVDEAHCISSYGHDFRPAYRKLGAIRQELQGLPIMALTATASARVQDDICQQLKLRNPLRLVSTFNRPNIHYQVRYVDAMVGPDGKTPLQEPLPDLVTLLERECHLTTSGEPPCCIIYTHKRDGADSVARALSGRGIACKAYHAGMPDKERSAVLAEWSAGRSQVVAATVAFGMGIDRADVRLVIHYNLPKSIEGFYQESGRAGRDGAPARSILYYSNADMQSLEYILQNSKDKLKRRYPHQQQSSLHPTQLQSFGPVVDYCLKGRCRRSFVLAHFGEHVSPQRKVGCCDVCDDPGGVAMAVRIAQTAGLWRRQRFLGGKHSLEFGGGRVVAGRLEGALEFELDRPGEGLEFDGEPPSSFFRAEDVIEDPDKDESAGVCKAQAALKRARQTGVRDPEGVLAAMETAERLYSKQELSATGAGQGSKSRLLAKLEGRAGATLRVGGGDDSNSHGVPENLRENARRQLGRAIADNPFLAAAFATPGSSGDCQEQKPQVVELAEQAAAALEQQCWEEVQSKTIYQCKMANLIMQLKKTQRSDDVPPVVWPLLKAIGTTGSSGQGASVAGQVKAMQSVGEQGATGCSLSGHQQEQGQQLPLTQQQQLVISAESLQGLMNVAQQAAKVSVEQAGVESTAAAIARAVYALRQLTGAKVSADLLLQTGAGKQIRALTKHGNAGVAAEAAKVYQAWKAAVLVPQG